MKVLIADDEKAFCQTVKEALSSHCKTEIATSVEEALDYVDRLHGELSLVLLDIEFRGEKRTGMDVLEHIRSRYPLLPVIMISGKGTLEMAVKATKIGAENFVDKASLTSDHLVKMVTELIQPATKSNNELFQLLKQNGIIAKSNAMAAVAEKIYRYAQSDFNVLITGESGTGKRLVAEAIHRTSKRKNGPFVWVNLPGIPPDLFQSQMFGHVRGAFTGALQNQKGFFHAAHQGTLFLDEIADLPLSCQISLLIPLETKQFTRVGATEVETVDIRIISATDRDLARAVEEGTFRQQLYYRLREVEIYIPPLRERREDIAVIAQHKVSELNQRYEKQKFLTPTALAYLTEKPAWRGNVRELLNVINVAYLEATDTDQITDEHIRRALREENPRAEQNGLSIHPAPTNGGSNYSTLDAITATAEKQAIIEALKAAKGNVSKAAAQLGVSRETLYNRMKKFAIKPSDYRSD
ncbi:MAG: sigma-54 dependent transcriptional regulator [Bacteroidota bacterium]|nr:sigma-54 dependent transcriptional regulator [Candidatus Kapabacteria bacterium]MCS7302686.1 sigma-54 dependent transcriptional regulator [Candidatus Kapabacteria bacterium]MCX7936194.1 sigma-54 dependent transcriptional regulator [Chlorobiota bacterium]MDW8074912.1 sigma-54 dependent transcriptional regulator [Bacteroidota bacterium]MDW8271551.1 sigma-54 dependent transcriptional regulator [Bacteroidota bacterium]